ncbi:MAG: MATE family efflux transporter [Oscillospiraceae bacterium]|nr:MATE family efflux transporter [Oscillospiraceae bacterium]
MVKNREYLGTAPIKKLLFQLAVPAITAQLINMLYNLVDRIFIGHIPQVGPLALTGVGVCMPMIMLVSAFAAFVSMGAAPKASIFMGENDYERAEKTLGNCFVLQLLISVLLTIVLLIWNRDFLLMFGCSENTIDYAVGYMKIYSMGTVFVQLALGMNAFITAQGFAKTSMFTVLIGAVCNMILDPIFIYGFQMGLRGAAWATIFSQAVSCVWILRFLAGPKTLICLKRHYMKLTASILLPCMTLGLSPFIMQASESAITVCFNASLQKYGGDIAVGAMTILASVMMFAMLPLQGLAQGAQPITSYNFGAKNVERVRKTFFLLLRTCTIYSAVLWLAVMAVPQLFAIIFTSDSSLIEFTSWAIRIYMGGMALFGAQIACQMTFIAIGNAKSSITVAVLRKFILLIPLIYLLSAVMPQKTLAIYLAEPISDTISVLFTVCLFAVQFKKALRTLR